MTDPDPGRGTGTVMTEDVMHGIAMMIGVMTEMAVLTDEPIERLIQITGGGVAPLPLWLTGNQLRPMSRQSKRKRRSLIQS